MQFERKNLIKYSPTNQLKFARETKQLIQKCSQFELLAQHSIHCLLSQKSNTKYSFNSLMDQHVTKKYICRASQEMFKINFVWL